MQMIFGKFPNPVATPFASLAMKGKNPPHFSPDGNHKPYQQIAFWDPEWRNHRGGQAKPIWIVDLKDFSLKMTPQTDYERHTDPIWLGNKVFYISERDFWPTSGPMILLPNRKSRRLSSKTLISKASMPTVLKLSMNRADICICSILKLFKAKSLPSASIENTFGTVLARSTSEYKKFEYAFKSASVWLQAEGHPLYHNSTVKEEEIPLKNELYTYKIGLNSANLTDAGLVFEFVRD